MTEINGKSFDPALVAEFEMSLAKAGVTVMEDRKAGVLAAYAEQKRFSAILRKKRSPFDEPANVYNITELARERE